MLEIVEISWGKLLEEGIAVGLDRPTAAELVAACSHSAEVGEVEAVVALVDEIGFVVRQPQLRRVYG